MFLACSRFIFFLSFLSGALVLGTSLFLEYGSGLSPCLLCYVQRFFLLGFCLTTLTACLRDRGPVGMWCFSVLSLLMALAGAASAFRQVLVQALPPEQLMFCQPELACVWHYLSPREILAMIYRGSEQCAHIQWSVFNLSIPELSLLAFTGLSVLSIVQVVRVIYYQTGSRTDDVK